MRSPVVHGLAWALALLLPAAGAAAACASTPACLQVIEAAQRDTRTITADFVQVKHISLLDEPLTSTGRFVFKRPDRIRLQIDKPQPALIVINGHDVQMPNLPERERKALAMAPVATMFQQLGAIFTGNTQALQEGFEVSAAAVAGADPPAIAVDLQPRLAAWQQMFRTIHIRFAGAHWMAQEIRLENGLGDRLEISLRNVQRNTDVPDAIFETKKP